MLAWNDVPSWPVRLVSAASMSDCWTKAVTVWVPPVVAW